MILYGNANANITEILDCEIEVGRDTGTKLGLRRPGIFTFCLIPLHSKSQLLAWPKNTPGGAGWCPLEWFQAAEGIESRPASRAAVPLY